MTDEKKKYETEWSFSFENLGSSINKMFASLGEEVKTETFTAPLAGATSADIHIGGSVGHFHLYALDAGDELIRGDLVYTGEIVFEITGDSTRSVTLKQAHPKDLTPPEIFRPVS